MFGLGERLYTTRSQCLWRSEEGIGTGVTDFYERHVGTEPWPLICRAVPSAQLLGFFLKEICLFLFYVYESFTCMYVNALKACLVRIKTRRGH